MADADLRPLHLAIVQDGGALAFSLSDARALWRHANLPLQPRHLAGWLLRAQALQRECAGTAGATGTTGGEVEARRCLLGTEMFQALLPAVIGGILAQSTARSLTLQVSPALAPLPWEMLHDGSAFLGDKFALVRQIIDDAVPQRTLPARAQRSLLRVLLIAGQDSPQPCAAYIGRLHQIIGTFDRIEPTLVQADDMKREDLLRLAASYEVLHYAGPVNPAPSPAGGSAWWPGVQSLGIEQLAALPHPPLLLISDNTDTLDAGGRDLDGSCDPSDPSAPSAARLAGNAALAAAACGAGLNLLARDLHATGDVSLDLMREFYRKLARGAALAEALRHARQTASTAGALYGDGALVPLPSGVTPRDEDNLRQITTLSFDLVGSTALLARLGAERYSEVLAGFHHTCTSIISRHGGVADDPQGDDGIMSYFGFPVAHENAAAHALQAGVALLEDVAKLGLQIRIGVATGQVIIKSGQPVGVSIHLAARLQSIAPAGTMLISENTRPLVRSGFVFEAVSPVPALKGIDQPGAVFRVSVARRQSDATGLPPSLTPFTGRQHEYARLRELWTAAAAGNAQTVMITGDPGIGKSRLMRQFRHSLEAAGVTTREYRGLAGRASTALYPVTEYIRRAWRIRVGEAADISLEKIKKALREYGLPPRHADLAAALLSVEPGLREGRPAVSADEQRQQILGMLTEWTVTDARQAPLCLVVEDLHWIDPTTRELIVRMQAATAQLPLMLVLTARTGAEPAAPAATGAHEIEAHEIHLAGLPPETARAMLVNALGQAALPGEVVRLLAARADGVPLFIEEAARMVVDSGGDDGNPGDSHKFTLTRSGVPATIQDLLMARLDRLEHAKPAAQAGAAIGREFNFDLLAAVLAHQDAPIQIADLPAQLQALVRSGLVIEVSPLPDGRYYFKHALVRDVAYQSLLERDRTRLHQSIAKVLAGQFAHLAQAQPELLAYHYTEAGLGAEALSHWERAAQIAAAQSAQDEVISHLRNALRVVAQQPASAARDIAELRLQVMLGARLIATEGYGAALVEDVYRRATELCHAAGDRQTLAKVQLGVSGYRFMRGEFARALELASCVAQTAADANNSVHKVQSAWAIANITFHQGDLGRAVRLMDACLADYEAQQVRRSAVQDPGIMCLCYSSWGHWQLGNPDESIRRAHLAVKNARDSGHKFSMAEAHGFRAAAHYFRGEFEAALQDAGMAVDICEESGFRVWLAHATMVRGRLHTALGETQLGNSEMRRGYDLWSATGAMVTRPFYLVLRAEGEALTGNPQAGLALLAEALSIVARCGERYYLPEVHRQMGELILQTGASLAEGAGSDDSAGGHWLQNAEQHLVASAGIARELQMRSLQLRSAMSLARLRQRQGRGADAAAALAAALKQISGGEGTLDVRNARSLLEQLGAAVTA